LCKVIILLIKNSAVCENAINLLKKGLSAEDFNKFVKINYVEQESISSLDEEYGRILGIPSIILKNDDHVDVLLGGDPTTIKKAIDFIRECKSSYLTQNN